MLRTRFAVLMTLAGLALTPVLPGCASSTSDPDNNNPDDNNPDTTYRIDFVTTGRAFPANTSADFTVRYSDNNGNNQQGATISFRIEGGTNASLNQSNVLTDANGQATVNVRMGSPGQFTLFAKSPDSNVEAQANITVAAQAFGDLKYVVDYSGARSIPRVEVGLFGGTSCASLRAGTVPNADDARATVIRRQETVTQVSVGDAYAIYALGIDSQNRIAAEGCLDVTDFAAADTTPRSVQITDSTVRRYGTYDTNEIFDITEGFNPTVQFVFDAISGVTSDPAAWIVDTIVNWNSTPLGGLATIPSSVTDLLGNPILGNTIKDLLRPLFGSLVSITPGWLRDFGYAINDLSGAFQRMNIQGQLEVPATNGTEFTVTGMHTLTGISVPRTGATPAVGPILRSASTQLTVGETLTVGEHTVNFEFGVLLRQILEAQILSRFNDGNPISLTDTLLNLIQCDNLAAGIMGDSSISTAFRGIAASACTVAVTLLSNLAQNLLFTGVANWTSLKLQGTAQMVDADGDYDAELLRNGAWNATWTSSGESPIGAPSTLNFTGTWTGTLNPDPSSTQHPIRARLTGLQ